MRHGKHVKKIQNIITDKLGIESDVAIDRCHRIGPRKMKTRRKKLKNTGIFIYEDFSKATMELGKSLWEQVLEYPKQNKFACLNYRSIIVRDRNGVR